VRRWVDGWNSWRKRVARGASKLKLLATGSPRSRSESEGEGGGELRCASGPVAIEPLDSCCWRLPSRVHTVFLALFLYRRLRLG
jgi:hypothetical protein